MVRRKEGFHPGGEKLKGELVAVCSYLIAESWNGLACQEPLKIIYFHPPCH